MHICPKCKHTFGITGSMVSQFRNKGKYCLCPACNVAIKVEEINTTTIQDILQSTGSVPFVRTYKVRGLM